MEPQKEASPPPLPLVSEWIEGEDSVFTEEELLRFVCYANSLSDTLNITNTERRWLRDYLINLPMAMQKKQEKIQRELERIESNLNDASNRQEFLNNDQNREQTHQKRPNLGNSNNNSFIDSNQHESIFDVKSGRVFRDRFQSRGLPTDRHEYEEQGNFFHRPNFGHSNSRSQVMRVKLNEILMMPQKFEGKKADALTFIDEFEVGAAANEWNEATMVKFFPTYLGQSPRDWF